MRTENRGKLRIEGCPDLIPLTCKQARSLPWWTVRGLETAKFQTGANATLTDCPNLSTISENGRVAGSLVVRNAGVTRLAGLSVAKDAEFSGCGNLWYLSPTTRIGGRLSWNGAAIEPELPSNTAVLTCTEGKAIWEHPSHPEPKWIAAAAGLAATVVGDFAVYGQSDGKGGFEVAGALACNGSDLSKDNAKVREAAGREIAQYLQAAQESCDQDAGAAGSLRQPAWFQAGGRRGQVSCRIEV